MNPERGYKPGRPPLARLTRRTAVHLALAGLSLLFLTPFIWLLVTSLKPIDQAMSLPPSFVPRAFHAVIDSERLEVTREFHFDASGAVVELLSGDEAGRRVALTDAALAARPAGRPVRVIDRFPADSWLVRERPAGGAPPREPRWAVVPAAAVESAIHLRWSNYPKALRALGDERDGVGFTDFLFNTLTVCVLGVIGTVFSNAVVAYGFARVRWRGRDAFFALTLATMMVPFPVLMVPLYGVFKNLGLIGTLVPLWLPSFFGSAFNIFLMRQFFRTIPEELSEAARIDGCSEWRIFWRIVLPLSKPVLATAGLFHFLHAWNDFMGPLLYLTRKEDYTLALALQSFQSQHGGVQWNYLMAASAVVIAPTIVIFFLAQKTFVQGIATTGSKS